MHTKVFIGRDAMMRKILLITQLKIQFDIMRKTNFETRKSFFFLFQGKKLFMKNRDERRKKKRKKKILA